MQQVLNALAVHQEDCGVVQHFGKVGNVVLFDSFASICQLQLTLWVGFFADLAEDNVGERRFWADHDFRTQIANRFDDIAVDEERPELGNIHEVEVRLRKLNGLVFREENGIAVDDLKESLVWKILGDLMQF